MTIVTVAWLALAIALDRAEPTVGFEPMSR